MRRIIVHTFNDLGFDQRVEAAMAFARTFDAHLTAMHVRPDISSVGGSYSAGMFTGVIPDSVIEQAKTDETEFQQHCERMIASEDVAWDWLVRSGLPEREFSREAVLADLLIISPLEDDFSGQAGDTFIGRMLSNASSPILTAVSAQPKYLTEGRILVLWNGSDEAGRALKGALPIIDRAAEVRILSIGGVSDGKPDEEDVAKYLGRGGTKAETLVAKEHGNIGEQILEEASAFGADLIVMGAYGRSRMSELILGGATQSMIRQRKFPVLFSH